MSSSSEMHDRINREIQARVPNLGGVNLVELVDGILTALREPSEAMVDAAWTADVVDGYQRMIDAARS